MGTTSYTFITTVLSFGCKWQLSRNIKVLSHFFQSVDTMISDHPEYNRNQIRELAQTLMDGRVLDELIHKKVEDYNTRWDELMQRVRASLLKHYAIAEPLSVFIGFLTLCFSSF